MPMSEQSRNGEQLLLRVEVCRRQAERITSYELVSPRGVDLPVWKAGDHVDIHLPSGTLRQYSLCGDPADRGRWRIGVLEQPGGRGGSVEAHRELRPGAIVGVGQPRSEFALAEGASHLFVAGGIGITPLLPMLREAESRGDTWSLVYGARSKEHFAFLDELAAFGDRVRLVAQDTDGLIDIAALVAASPGTAVHCCGPAPLIDALTAEMERVGRTADLHVERFAPAPLVSSGGVGGEGSFEVTLARSESVVTVESDVTILDAIRAAGFDHPSSCEMGICGACEVKVLAGQVDHRDDLLSDDEKANGSTMMICVSRACGDRLVIDL